MKRCIRKRSIHLKRASRQWQRRSLRYKRAAARSMRSAPRESAQVPMGAFVQQGCGMCAAARRLSIPRLADSSGLLGIRSLADTPAHGPHKGSMDAHICSNRVWRKHNNSEKSLAWHRLFAFCSGHKRKHLREPQERAMRAFESTKGAPSQRALIFYDCLCLPC